ncbi:MAG: transporter suffix domain-containing protein [Reyranella sp.]|nr:transporter suffix domain-containing protein [Reyranella sp.]
MAPPDFTANWRFVAGISILGLAMVLPLCALLIPLLDLPVAQSALIAGALVAGAPEVLMLLAVALLGRQNFDRIVGTAKKFLFTTFFSTPVSRGRYYAGLAICLLSFIPLYVAGYVPSWMPTDNGRIVLLAAADLAFIFSFFIMGGEFWEKFRRLFVWEGRV